MLAAQYGKELKKTDAEIELVNPLTTGDPPLTSKIVRRYIKIHQGGVCR